jgi:hypothetical protein
MKLVQEGLYDPELRVHAQLTCQIAELQTTEAILVSKHIYSSEG